MEGKEPVSENGCAVCGLQFDIPSNKINVFAYHAVVWSIDSIFPHGNWRAKVSCDLDVNQSAGNMVM